MTYICSLAVNDGVSYVVYGSYTNAPCTSPVVSWIGAQKWVIGIRALMMKAAV